MSNEIPKFLGTAVLALLTLPGCAGGSNAVEHQPITQTRLQQKVDADIAKGLQTLNPAIFRPQELEGFRLTTTATDANTLSETGMLRLTSDYHLSNTGVVSTNTDYKSQGGFPKLVHDTVAYVHGFNGEGPLERITEKRPDGKATIDPKKLDEAFRIVFPNTPFLSTDIGPLDTGKEPCIGGYITVDKIRYFGEACSVGFFQAGREFLLQ